MITKVVHGWRVGGLIAYLMGPGRAQEHVNPRVIATWDGRDAGWQPPRPDDEARPELGPLIRALRAPALAAGLDEGGVEGKRGYVWHCSARVAAGDRVLSDSEWAEIARELLDGAGVARRDETGGPRWVAVRHADDHIHIAVVLVRRDTCRRFWPFRDYPRLREAARHIEDRLGSTVTAVADGTAARAPGRGEIEKARRQGREPARVELARAVREAAVASDGPAGFVDALQRAGYLVEVRRAPSGDPLGFKVARPGDVTASGDPGRAVPGGEHEPVAVGPGRVARVMSQEPGEDRPGGDGRTQREVGVPAAGGLHGLRREHPDRGDGPALDVVGGGARSAPESTGMAVIGGPPRRSSGAG